MITIYKYKLELTEYQEISLPKNSEILHFNFQNQIPYIWAVVDTKKPMELVKFVIRGTGHPILTPETLDYCGTALDGPFVWHLFRIKD